MKPIPFLRICLPFIGGIILAQVYQPCLNVLYLLGFEALVLCLLCFFLFVWKKKFFEIVLLDLFFLVLAQLLVLQINNNRQLQLKPLLFDPTLKQTYVGFVSEIPTNKEKFVKCPIQITHVLMKHQLMPFKTEIIAYFKKDQWPRKFLPGQFYLMNTRLIMPQSPKNPGEFDYAQYLKHKHMYYTAFIDSKNYQLFQHPLVLGPGIQLMGLKFKQQLLDIIHQASLSENAAAICSALLTGYDDDIDKAVMNAFSHSGTLHVLSVSGLHTGLIYLLLNFIFNVFDPHNRFKIFRYVLITALLWLFALITGFSAPVLRAVLMFNFLGLAKLIKRQSDLLNVNILLFSAFILLFYNVDFVFDVGFLLSYAAMLGILVFAPNMLKSWQIKNTFLKYCFESGIVSIAATISTLPITLYYFNQFPTWFVLCNLVVVPLSFVVLLLSFLLVFKIAFVDLIINALVKLMLVFIGFFSEGKFSYINYIHFNSLDALFLTCLTLLLYFFLMRKNFIGIALAFILLITWQCYNLYDSSKSKLSKTLTIYCVKGKSSVLLKNRNLALYNNTDSLGFQYSLSNHFVTFNYAMKCHRNFNFLDLKQQKMVILNTPNRLPICDKSNVTHLLVANNFCLNPTLFSQFKKLKLVVVDASNRLEIIHKTVYLCRKFGIAFYDVRKSGAYTMELQ